MIVYYRLIRNTGYVFTSEINFLFNIHFVSKGRTHILFFVIIFDLGDVCSTFSRLLRDLKKKDFVWLIEKKTV